MTTTGWVVPIWRVVAARTSSFALLLGEFGLAPAIAPTFDEEDLDVVSQAVDQGDGAGGVGEDGVPVLERQVGCDEQGAVLVTTTDELEEQVGGAGVVGEVAQFVDHDQRRPGLRCPLMAGFDPSAEVEVEQEVGGRGEAGGVSGEDGLVGDVLGEHGLAEALGPDQDDVLAAGEEVEGEDAFEGWAVEGGRPVPVPVGEGLEASQSGAGESALDAAALSVFEWACPGYAELSIAGSSPIPTFTRF